MPNDNVVTPIPFSFFVSLCKELSNIEPQNVHSTTRRIQDSEPRAIKVLRRWVQELRHRFPRPPQGTTTSLFFFLFPEEDVHRKYGMQEATLARALSAVLGVSDKKGGRGAKLKQWAASSNNASSLGDEVHELMSRSYVDNEGASSTCLNELDSLLDELATKSSFSSSAVRSSVKRPVRKRQNILQAAYRGLRPFEATVLTQIILKDLRPVIYPVKDTSTTSSLLDFNVAAIHELTLYEAMHVWDPSGTLLRCYRVQSTIDHSIALFEEGSSRIVIPRVGVPIQIPKCVKGQGCANALTNFKTSTSVWAETKYDGERMQIHVAVDDSGESEITIFSKSKRDSTLDRIATHWIIREALGLPHKRVEEIRARAATRARSQVVSSIILDAEMVAYDDATGIDEFWRIRELIESTAYGARRKVRCDQLKEQFTSSASGSSRHLALVFFDILYFNERSFLSQPYCTRRAVLEEIISPILSYASFSYREEIPLSQTQSPCQGLMGLQRIFQHCILDHEEGLVLKASDATYADWRNPWVKLKKDYIPGHGDSVDLVIIAATWEKDRGRSLRVPTSTYTTFYVGVACDKPGLVRNVKLQPHFEVVFTVSYGLDRNQLEELNHLIRTMGTVDYEADIQRSGLSFTFNLTPSLTKPCVILTTPLLVDLFGAGFTKSNGTNYYELRFPRISKVYRSNDRNWREGLNMEQYDKIVRESIGKLNSTSEERNNQVLMPSGCPTKRKSFGTLQIQNFAQRDAGQLPDTYEYSELSSGRCQKRRKENEKTFQRSTMPISPRRRLGSFARINVVGRCAKGPLKYVTNHETEIETYVCSEVVLDCHSHTEVGEIAKADQRYPEEKLAFAPLVNEHGVHPFAAFLDRSVILSNCSFSSLEYDEVFINRFVLPNLVHSHEAIAFACEWNCQAAMLVRGEPARYGIVFIDNKPSRRLQEILPFVSSPGALEAGRRPIFVFSADCLRAEALQCGWKDSEMDIKTRCLAVYL